MEGWVETSQTQSTLACGSSLSPLTCPEQQSHRWPTQHLGPPPVVYGWRWAPGGPFLARRAVAYQVTWVQFLRRGRVVLQPQAPGPGQLGWKGPDHTWDCWRSCPDCWPSQGPGHCSWHWGPHRTEAGEGSYLENTRRRIRKASVLLLQMPFLYLNIPGGPYCPYELPCWMKL